MKCPFCNLEMMEGYLCPSCRKVILDIPLVEEPPKR